MADTRYERHAGRGGGEGVRRDAALNRIGKLTKRIAVATVAAVGILGLYVSKSLPGHATTPASQSQAGTTTPTTSAPAAPSAGPSSAPSTAPSAPASPPVTTQGPAHVTTGAS